MVVIGRAIKNPDHKIQKNNFQDRKMIDRENPESKTSNRCILENND